MGAGARLAACRGWTRPARACEMPCAGAGEGACPPNGAARPLLAVAGGWPVAGAGGLLGLRARQVGCVWCCACCAGFMQLWLLLACWRLPGVALGPGGSWGTAPANLGPPNRALSACLPRLAILVPDCFLLRIFLLLASLPGLCSAPAHRSAPLVGGRLLPPPPSRRLHMSAALRELPG